jgi:hypothetical protein
MHETRGLSAVQLHACDNYEAAVACRVVRVVKQELRLTRLVQRYKKAKLDLEDLTDKWISYLRRKKTVSRRQITVKPDPKDPAHVKRWGKGRTKADEMDVRVWQLQDAKAKLNAEQSRARDEVCPSRICDKDDIFFGCYGLQYCFFWRIDVVA